MFLIKKTDTLSPEQVGALLCAFPVVPAKHVAALFRRGLCDQDGSLLRKGELVRADLAAGRARFTYYEAVTKIMVWPAMPLHEVACWCEKRNSPAYLVIPEGGRWPVGE